LTPVTRPFGRISHIYHRIWSVCFTALFPDLLDQICLRTLAGKTKIPVKNPRENSSPKHDPTRVKILLKKTRPDPTREVKTKETKEQKTEVKTKETRNQRQASFPLPFPLARPFRSKI
jgi:hypothetical protein